MSINIKINICYPSYFHLFLNVTLGIKSLVNIIEVNLYDLRYKKIISFEILDKSKFNNWDEFSYYLTWQVHFLYVLCPTDYE